MTTWTSVKEMPPKAVAKTKNDEYIDTENATVLCAIWKEKQLISCQRQYLCDDGQWRMNGVIGFTPTHYIKI